MSRVASLVTSFCFVVTAYAGGPFTMVFYPPYPSLRIDVWPLVMVVCAAATVVCTYSSRDTRRPSELAFWGLVIKLSFLPFFFITCLLMLFLGSYLFAPVARTSGFHPPLCAPGGIRHHDRYFITRVRSDQSRARGATHLP